MVVACIVDPIIVTRVIGAPGWKETESRLDHPWVHRKGYPLR